VVVAPVPEARTVTPGKSVVPFSAVTVAWANWFSEKVLEFQNPEFDCAVVEPWIWFEAMFRPFC
jgi:hypothetical protein